MQKCDRCGGDANPHIMSKFNREELCLTCKDDEESAPGYEAASAAERVALKHGNPNFSGIGLSLRDREFLTNALNFRLKSPFKVGQQVKLSQEVERYPHFLIPVGATGKVKTLRHDLVEVKMDEPVDGMQEWDGCLQWYPENVPEHQEEYLKDLEAV